MAQPIHLYSFIAEYLQDQLMVRDSNEPPSHRMIRYMVEDELTYEAMLKRWGVSTALANYAATIIQAVYRGHRTRKAMPKKTQEDDKVVEAKHSQVLPDGSVYWEEATKAAICIQRNFRQTVIKPKQEKPPGEPQQRRRTRRVGPPNPTHQHREVVTAPAELTSAFESTAKEACVVGVVEDFDDPVQSTSRVQEQEARASAASVASHKRLSKHSLAKPHTQEKEARPSVAFNKQLSKQSVTNPHTQETEARPSVDSNKQFSKRYVTKPHTQKKEAKPSVKSNKQLSWQSDTKPHVSLVSKQAAATPGKRDIKKAGTTPDKKNVKKASFTPGKQDVKKAGATSDEDVKKASTTLDEEDVNLIPLSGVAESYCVVLPIVDSLLWYVLSESHDSTTVPASGSVLTLTASRLQVAEASSTDDENSEATTTSQLESLVSSPNQDGVFAPGEQRAHSILDDVQTSLEANTSATFVVRCDSVSVMEEPPRWATTIINVESQEFYQAHECLSSTENERARLSSTNGGSNIGIHTKDESSSTREVSTQSELVMALSEIGRTDAQSDGRDGNDKNGAESAHLLASTSDVPIAHYDSIFDESDYNNVPEVTD